MPQSPTRVQSPLQDIPGGTCPLTPMQICLLWSARQEKIISPLSFRVYFASQEVKYWRATPNPSGYHYEPYGFQPTDIGRLLPGVPETKITKAFHELVTVNILNMTDNGIWFAESPGDTTLIERAKQHARAMFNQLNENTRNRIIKIPRRLLKVIIQCGRQIVRVATLFGMLLTTMLTKRRDRYGGYKGCCKAEWIGRLFNVNSKRVNLERAKLINEGWFARESTAPRVRKKHGQWVRLNLTPFQPTPEPEVPNQTALASGESAIGVGDIEELHVEEPLVEVSMVRMPDANAAAIVALVPEFLDQEAAPDDLACELISEQSVCEEPDIEMPPIPMAEVQPQNPSHEPKVQPLPNLLLSSHEEISNNQVLTPGEATPGVYKPLPPKIPTWKNICLPDLQDDTRSEALRQEAIRLGYLKNTQADRINFFSAIAHALRVAKNNACGLLRTIVEKNLWHVISQADEYSAVQRLRRLTQQTASTQPAHSTPFLVTDNDKQLDEQPFVLSEDALIVQTLTSDLNRAGIKDNILNTVQRHGYLTDWDKKRWLQAEQEILHARLLWVRQRYQVTDIPAIGDVIEDGLDSD